MSSYGDEQALRARVNELEAQLAILSGKAQPDVLGGKEGRVEASSEVHLNAENGPHMEAEGGSDFEEGEINEDHVAIVQDTAMQDYPPVGIEHMVKNKGDHTTGTKRTLSPSQEEQGSSKRIQRAESWSFKQMQSQKHPVPCMLSINSRQPIGWLYQTDKGLAITASLDPGVGGPPTMMLGFKAAGSKSSMFARNCWDTESIVRGQWAMREFYAGHVTSDETDSSASHSTIFAACRPEDKKRIIYMRFQSWSQVAGFMSKTPLRALREEIRRSMTLIFKPKKPYIVECWFIAPWQTEAFRRQCLMYFNESFANRVRPLEFWEDPFGVEFLSLPLQTVSRFLNVGPSGFPLRTEGSVPEVQRNQPPNSAQDTNTLRDIPDDKAVQSVAQDAEMSSHSGSPLTGALPTPRRLGTQTTGATDLALPTEARPISPSSFFKGSEVPKSTSSATNPYSSSFVPAFLQGIRVDDDDNDNDNDDDNDDDDNDDNDNDDDDNDHDYEVDSV